MMTAQYSAAGSLPDHAGADATTLDSPLSRFFEYEPRRAEYLVNFSPRYRYAYVEVPKVACTTVKRLLQLAEVDGHSDVLPDSVHDKAASPVLSPSDDMDRFLRTFSSGELFRFAFVRNPYTRVLSAYLDKIVINEWERTRRLPAMGFDPNEQVSFAQFLRYVASEDPAAMDIHWAPQSLLMGVDRVEYDFIGRFENFGNDLAAVAAYLEIDPHLPAVGNERPHATGASSRIAEHYTETHRQIVQEIYAEDFDRFGYGRGLQVV